MHSDTWKTTDWLMGLLVLASISGPVQIQAETKGLSKPQQSMIEVQPGVKLEVLDFGGQGTPLVFLAALGRDAHDFEDFAPNFTTTHHVYAVTRRGFGISDKPQPTDENYDADRLGDDVLKVMEALRLDRPFLVGHSVGGEELSSVGSRHPEKVRGLIYLEAGYSYAFYNSAQGDALADQTELRRLTQEALQAPPTLELERRLLASLELNERELKASIAKKEGQPSQPQLPAQAASGGMPPPPPAMKAMVTNTRKYTRIQVPILAIFAVPHDLSRQFKDPVVRASKEAQDAVSTGKQADAFEAGLASSHVLRIAKADHDIFVSAKDEVIAAMNQFMNSLEEQSSR